MVCENRAMKLSTKGMQIDAATATANHSTARATRRHGPADKPAKRSAAGSVACGATSGMWDSRGFLRFRSYSSGSAGLSASARVRHHRRRHQLGEVAAWERRERRIVYVQLAFTT